LRPGGPAPARRGRPAPADPAGVDAARQRLRMGPPPAAIRRAVAPLGARPLRGAGRRRSAAVRLPRRPVRLALLAEEVRRLAGEEGAEDGPTAACTGELGSVRL